MTTFRLIFVAVALSLSSAAAHEAAGQAAPRLRSSDAKVDPTSPRKQAIRERKQRCMNRCTSAGDKPRSQCRAECTGNERSIGPGKTHTTPPTPTPPTRAHIFCVQDCMKQGGTRTQCERGCPEDEEYAFE